jgi:RAD3-like DEAD/DEAH box helicase
MSLGELQSWLVQEGLREELDELTLQTVRIELDNLVNLPSDDQGRPSPDWPRLLFAGSILSRSGERWHQDAALRIATAAITLSSANAVRDTAAVLLGKLSNFRAIALAFDRELITADLEGRLGITLRIEAQRRQMEQAVLVESSGRWLPVNDFQQRFWSSAGDHGWLSASAPTASGKTFVVLQWLLDQMRSTNSKVAVYLAPTRALVSEIEASLQLLLGKSPASRSLPCRCAQSSTQRSGAARSSSSYSPKNACISLLMSSAPLWVSIY